MFHTRYSFLPAAGPFAFVASLLLTAPPMVAQPTNISTELPTTASLLLPAPMPDVLNPNRRINTPDVKVALRGAFTRSSYSNDRYLDNTPLDVGETEGEIEVYTSAAGFGYSVGIDLEYPVSSGFSWVATLEYNHVAFGSSGTVRQSCLRSDGSTARGTAVHDFTASLDLLKVAGTGRLSFSSWYLFAGIAADHPLASSLERSRQLGDENCLFAETGTRRIDESGEIPGVKALHYSWRLGWGLIYKIDDRLRFTPEMTLDFGMSAINKSPESDLGVYAIGATIRYDLR